VNVGDDRHTVGSGLVLGGPTFAKKDNAGRRYSINPGRAFDWRPCRGRQFLFFLLYYFNNRTESFLVFDFDLTW